MLSNCNLKHFSPLSLQVYFYFCHHHELPTFSTFHLKFCRCDGKAPLTPQATQTLDELTYRKQSVRDGEKENVPSPPGLPGGGRSKVKT